MSAQQEVSLFPSPFSAGESAERARKLLQPQAAELTKLLADLVRVNTVAVPPNGNETPGQRVLQQFLQRHGVKTELYDMSFVTGIDSP